MKVRALTVSVTVWLLGSGVGAAATSTRAATSPRVEVPLPATQAAAPTMPGWPSVRPAWAQHSYNPKAAQLIQGAVRERRSAKSSYVASVVLSGKPPVKLSATFIDVVKTFVTLPAPAPHHAGHALIENELQISLDVVAEPYAHRLLAAVTGNQPFAEATVSAYAGPGGKTAVTDILTRPSVKLLLAAGADDEDRLTLTAGAWKASFSGGLLPLNTTAVGEASLHQGSSVVRRVGSVRAGSH